MKVKKICKKVMRNTEIKITKYNAPEKSWHFTNLEEFYSNELYNRIKDLKILMFNCGDNLLNIFIVIPKEQIKFDDKKYSVRLPQEEK